MDTLTDAQVDAIIAAAHEILALSETVQSVWLAWKPSLSSDALDRYDIVVAVTRGSALVPLIPIFAIDAVLSSLVRNVACVRGWVWVFADQVKTIFLHRIQIA